MARKRLKQKQSADLYFQEHHHREIIYDDAYVEALYLEKMVEPQWRRYKPKNLFGNANAPEGETIAFSLDLENKFMSIDKFMSDIDLLNKGMMQLGNYNINGKYITKNCHDFKEYPLQIETNLFYSKPFGSNAVASIMSDTATMKLDVTRINYRESERTGSSNYFSVTKQLTPRSEGTSIVHKYGIICPTSNGCLLWHTEYDHTNERVYEEIYQATSSSITLLKEFEGRDAQDTASGATPSTFESTNYGMHENGFYMFPHTYNVKVSSNQYRRGLIIYYAPDSDPTNWNTYELVEAEPSYRRSNSIYGNLTPRISYKDGVFYIYVLCNESYLNNQIKFRTLLSKTSDFVTYETVELPMFIDIPAFELEDDNSYGHITQSYYGVVRIVFNNIDNTGIVYPTYEKNIKVATINMGLPTYTSTDADFLSTNYCVSLISNGKNVTKEVEYLARIYGNVIFYIDNMTFEESENNLVYGIDSSGYYMDIDNTEHLNDGDYVLGGRKVEND